MQFIQSAMKDSVKMLMWACGFNVVVAMMNLGFFVVRSLEGNWSSAATSGFLTVLNTVVAVFLWSKIREQRQKDKQRVADILSGKVKELDGLWYIDG